MEEEEGAEEGEGEGGGRMRTRTGEGEEGFRASINNTINVLFVACKIFDFQLHPSFFPI